MTTAFHDQLFNGAPLKVWETRLKKRERDRGASWQAAWGTPGQPGCKAHPDALWKFGFTVFDENGNPVRPRSGSAQRPDGGSYHSAPPREPSHEPPEDQEEPVEPPPQAQHKPNSERRKEHTSNGRTNTADIYQDALGRLTESIAGKKNIARGRRNADRYHLGRLPRQIRPAGLPD
jgi:hypothetical protein